LPCASIAGDRIVCELYWAYSYLDRFMSLPLPRPAELLCFSLYAATHALNRVYKPLLEPLGLTYPQYLVMLSLWAEDGQTVGGIGSQLFLESSTVTPLLKRLEGAGLVARARDAVDERVVRVRLTAAGSALRELARGIPDCVLSATGLDVMGATALRDEVERLRLALEHAAPAA
jgi:DNA-binding MarR family transcriptional regulator